MFLLFGLLAYFCVAEIIVIYDFYGKSISNLYEPIVGVHFSWGFMDAPTAGNASVHSRLYFFRKMQPRQIAIPKSLCSIIAADNSLLKPLTVFYHLKSFYKGGTIHNYRARYNEFAKKLGISPSKLRNEVKRLFALELAWVGEGKELRLASNNAIREIFGISTRKKDYIEVKPVSETEYHIKALSLNESLEHQKHIVGQKFLKKYTSIGSKLHGEAKQSVINYYLAKEKSVTEDNILKGIKSNINPSITLSRQGIARRLGRLSKSTGHRIANKLKALNLLSETKKIFKLKPCSYIEYYAIRIGVNQPNLFYKGGWMCLRMCNEITLTPNR